MRFYRTIVSSSILTILLSLSGCGSSSTANSTPASSTLSTANEWTWESGAKSVDSPYGGATGVYGTLGVAAASNSPGGRTGAVSWTDRSSNLWLFGGGGIDSIGIEGYLNDLWEFSSASNEWTWVSGANQVGLNGGVAGFYGDLGFATAGAVPGGRWDSVSWTDSSGNFWLFGGEGYDAGGGEGSLSDLWEFNPSKKEWIWMDGSTLASSTYQDVPGVYNTLGVAGGTFPGGRSGAVSWIDSSGNLWLFGGGGFDSTGTEGHLNDLCEFSPTTKEWTWVSGSSTAEANGVYGTLGVAAAGNTPGGRSGAVSWIDSSGNLWLFGGEGVDSTGTVGYLNDLWEFNPATKEWTWVGGANKVGSNGGVAGVYGTLGVAAASNSPAGRTGAVSWTDRSSNLWLFGGYGLGSVGMYGDLNDLWEFDPATKEWTWVSGANKVGLYGGVAGVYGTLGVASASNVPGGRGSAVSWTDSSGNFWLFGGDGSDSTGTEAFLNDLWKYQP
jgi:N-acetylneuraminic acid mutarotase